MDNDKQNLQDSNNNKRIFDYGSYRIIYDVSTGEITIYEDTRCVMKRANIKEVINYFENKKPKKTICKLRYQNKAKNRDYCREHELIRNFPM